jgi:hypothetical protein
MICQEPNNYLVWQWQRGCSWDLRRSWRQCRFWRGEYQRKSRIWSTFLWAMKNSIPPDMIQFTWLASHIYMRARCGLIKRSQFDKKIKSHEVDDIKVKTFRNSYALNLTIFWVIITFSNLKLSFTSQTFWHNRWRMLNTRLIVFSIISNSYWLAKDYLSTQAGFVVHCLVWGHFHASTLSLI